MLLGERSSMFRDCHTVLRFKSYRSLLVVGSPFSNKHYKRRDLVQNHFFLVYNNCKNFLLLNSISIFIFISLEYLFYIAFNIAF